MKPGLLLVRVGLRQARQIAANLSIRREFSVVTVDQDIYTDIRAQTYRDFPEEDYKGEVKKFIRYIILNHNIKHIIACQKLHWYSVCVEQIAKELEVDLIWTERFFDDKFVFDRVGLQYTKDNEIVKFSSLHKTRPYQLPNLTRLPQPHAASMAILHNLYGTGRTVVFGQCPTDMALVEYPDRGYYPWLHNLLSEDRLFLFKHHPLMKTQDIEDYANVQVVDENVHSLIDSYDSLAAFSSSVIFECHARGKTGVRTGGYHFLSEDASEQRFSFLCSKYAIKLGSKSLYDRITKSSEDYFDR